MYFHWDWGVEEEEDDGDDVDPPWVLMEAIGNIEIKFEAQLDLYIKESIQVEKNWRDECKWKVIWEMKNRSSDCERA